MADEMLTLREAARQLGRSAGTLRRYIKSGRLPAEKHRGKFGIEYRIRNEDLDRLRTDSRALAVPPAAGSPAPAELAELLHRFVPVTIYQQLAEKHERLLVEFGMLRGRQPEVGMEQPGQVVHDGGREALERKERELRQLHERSAEELDFMRRHLREAEQEVQDREADIITLRERVNRLEQGFLETDDPAVPASRAVSPRPVDAGPASREKVDRLRELLGVCERAAASTRGS